VRHDAYFLRSRRLGFRAWREGDLGLALSLWLLGRAPAAAKRDRPA